MKYALISDIHGNLEALTAVLDDIENRDVDAIHCLGDVIGYGADPVACLDLAVANCGIKLMGNHEFTALGLQSAELFNDAARLSAEWTQAQLGDKELAVIADFELDGVLDDIYLVHASPFEPDHWHYIFTTEEAVLAFEYLNQSIGFFGHSHLPMILTQDADGLPRIRAGHTFTPSEEGKYLINVGSVGQPRDNDPRACYVVFDDEEREVTFHRVEYDIKTTQRKMAGFNLPEVLISRLSLGR